MSKCTLCGEPMPPGEEMFKFHGYSGPCPAPMKSKIKTVVEYTHRDDGDGFWIDVCADGVMREPLGPFASAEVRQMAYDDLLSMMRATGASDLPNYRQ